ncbi:hypothetical protein KKF34_07985 [Myxococcota bacterium]|nr:hypothetical protein [Myxococcota bacterium]MBU1379398.1 hypothetical protein [Myxococcota bacterium]MBU1496800.1 hypothetical protein [Myxococcota bacterium]
MNKNLPHLAVITSCTGKKALQAGLTDADLENYANSGTLPEGFELKKAEEMYTGMQHKFLMEGVKRYRNAGGRVDVYILSAGLGLISGDQLIPAYDFTFSGKSKKFIQSWSRKLGISEKIIAASKSAEGVIFALGDSYLTAADIPSDESFSTSLFLCAPSSAAPDKSKALRLGMPEARRFKATLVALKGLLTARILDRTRQRQDFQQTFLLNTHENILNLLENP